VHRRMRLQVKMRMAAAFSSRRTVLARRQIA
jgi:hypothetical protein